MAQPQLGTDFGDTLFITKEDDFRTGAQKRPTGNGIPLDNGEMTLKGFASREDSQHLLKPPFPSGT
jgi:hypothetical protein